MPAACASGDFEQAFCQAWGQVECEGSAQGILREARQCPNPAPVPEPPFSPFLPAWRDSESSRRRCFLLGTSGLMLGYVREQIGNGQERISTRGMEIFCLSSAPILCSLALELSLTQGKQAAGFAGLVLGFFNWCFCVYHQPQKITWEKRHWWEEGEGIPSASPVSCHLVPGWQCGSICPGCVLVSASSASLGQPWHLFHQALSRNCPNFPDRRARCCQTSSWSKASNLSTTLLPALAMQANRGGHRWVIGFLPNISRCLKDGRAAWAHPLAGEEGQGSWQSSQWLWGKKNAVKVLKKTEQIINFLNGVARGERLFIWTTFCF